MAMMSDLQRPMAGGGMNLLPKSYEVYPAPIGDALKWGALAHVHEDVRKKILAAGEGEIKRHLTHIQNQINKKKRELKKAGRPLPRPMN